MLDQVYIAGGDTAAGINIVAETEIKQKETKVTKVRFETIAPREKTSFPSLSSVQILLPIFLAKAIARERSV